MYPMKNPNSTKAIVAIRLGEKMCNEHAGNGVTVDLGMGICYACASTHGEPKRAKLAK